MEIWRDVLEYEGIYQVSSAGRFANCKYERILKPRKHSGGYLNVQLPDKNNKFSNYYMHRLVLESFRGKSRLEVNHINGIKSDNRLSNLEYVSHAENLNHARKNGLLDIRGEKNGLAKLTELDVIEIKKMLKNKKLTHKEIAKKYSVSRSRVTSIKSGTTWKHLN